MKNKVGKKGVYKNWWFWALTVSIVLNIFCFTAIAGFNKENEELSQKLADANVTEQNDTSKGINDPDDLLTDGQEEEIMKEAKKKEEEQKEPEDNVFSIGEVAEYDGGLKVTVDSISPSDETPNGEISGNFIKIDFTIDNQTDDVVKFNSHSLAVYDGERNKAELDSKNFYSENIDKGMKASGSAYFDAKEKGPYTVIIGAGTWTE